jgi:hypothetical protein
MLLHRVNPYDEKDPTASHQPDSQSHSGHEGCDYQLKIRSQYCGVDVEQLP